MSKKISCTITVGAGSERHNHNLKYREALDHTHTADCPDAIIELIPYRPYKEQINELMKPYIDEYNEKIEARYKHAWDRYNSGEIKTKPRKRDFKKLDCDYFTEHQDDKVFNPHTKKLEDALMWREVILGLGDRDDRQKGKITKEEAVAVMKNVIDRWPELYPHFKLLGATIHLDEEGFYHCHINYKPLYEKDTPERGLSVGVGHDAALEHMGFHPEQSIINGRDKAPILFNGFRNRLYLEVEKELNNYGMRLLYGVSKIKEPNKDSSVNQKLEDWKASQDGIHELQKIKNHMLDIVEEDKVSPKGFKKAITAAKQLDDILLEVENQPRKRFKGIVEVSFNLFDQLRSIVQDLVNTIHHLLHQIDVLTDNLRETKAELEELRNKKTSLADRVTGAEERKGVLENNLQKEQEHQL